MKDELVDLFELEIEDTEILKVSIWKNDIGHYARYIGKGDNFDMKDNKNEIERKYGMLYHELNQNNRIIYYSDKDLFTLELKSALKSNTKLTSKLI